MRKIIFSIFLLFAFILSGCSSSTTSDEVKLDGTKKASYYQMAVQYVEKLENHYQTNTSIKDDSSVIQNAIESCNHARSDIGRMDLKTDKDQNGIPDAIHFTSITKNKDNDYVITITMKGSKHNADEMLTINPDDNAILGLSTTVDYSRSELMGQAAKNMVIGMGTTFTILLFLWFVVWLMGKINGKQEVTATVSEQTNENEMDDLQLVAVITAAIAASREETSTDGFIVRSIHRKQ